MDVITKQELRTLANASTSPCISIFMPTIVAGESIQNRIRFKNLQKSIESQIRSSNYDEKICTEYTAKLQLIYDDNSFWDHPKGGLALFLSPEGEWAYHLPQKFPELAIVNDRFLIKPLIQAYNQEGVYYLLSVSRDSISLYLGSEQGLMQIDLPEQVPQNIYDAVWQKGTQKEVRFHVSSSGAGGRPAVTYHGGSDYQDKNPEYYSQYLHAICTSLIKYVFDKQQKIPLVFAGDDYLHGLFRQVCTYHNLCDQALIGNFERTQHDELHKKSWAIIGPYLAKHTERILERYQELAGKGYTSSNIEEVVPASVSGSVDLLLITPDNVWGKYNYKQNQAEIHPEHNPGDEDLLNFAAMQTIANGGDVYIMDNIPEGREIAAIFRHLVFNI